MLSASRGHRDICQNLLDAGADPYAQDNKGRNAYDRNYIRLCGTRDIAAQILAARVASCPSQSNRAKLLTEMHSHVHFCVDETVETDGENEADEVLTFGNVICPENIFGLRRA
ncbi:MAG: hypothetical protein JWM11_6523 [Planctomycetaceae bacterium]|nr:hypothetical protein [Planctomycetaceae bacterium]